MVLLAVRGKGIRPLAIESITSIQYEHEVMVTGE
jgi:hypothetical protein